VIEQMQPAMHPSQRRDALRRNGQLLGRFGRRRGAALQRQQADDQLQAVDESMLEFLRQHDLASRQLVLFLEQHRFARESVLELGDQRVVRLLLAPTAEECPPKRNRKI
jgi:hypothetical protein